MERIIININNGITIGSFTYDPKIISRNLKSATIHNDLINNWPLRP